MLLQALQPQFIWTNAIRFLPLMPKQIISNMEQTKQKIITKEERKRQVKDFLDKLEYYVDEEEEDTDTNK